MKLIAFETETWEAEACRKALQSEHDFTCTDAALSAANAADFTDAEIVTVFVHSRLTPAVLAAMPKLRMIATRSTGYDHIDLAFCAKAGILVANVPNYGDVTVAEHVFALLLGLARHLPAYCKSGQDAKATASGLRGFDLYGKTLGVVGTGRIGQCVIRIAQGFGMRVIANDIAPRETIAQALNFRFVDLPTLLAEADIVSLHLPATDATRYLLGEAEFAAMRAGSVLINTARGNIIEMDALVRAISSGKIRAAGIDVLPQEPLIRDEAEVFRSQSVGLDAMRELLAYHVLANSPNVILTPHIAYNTDEALQRLIATTIANISAFAAGAPVNLVSAPAASA